MHFYYIYFEIGLYYLFISLIFDSEEKEYPMIVCEDEAARQECINTINNQNRV